MRRKMSWNATKWQIYLKLSYLQMFFLVNAWLNHSTCSTFFKEFIMWESLNLCSCHVQQRQQKYRWMILLHINHTYVGYNTTNITLLYSKHRIMKWLNHLEMHFRVKTLFLFACVTVVKLYKLITELKLSILY